MKIGVSTKIFDFHSWIRGAHETDFDTIEINNRTNNIPFYPEWIKKVKPMLKKFDLSLHTKTCDIFTSNNQFTKTEIETIK
jgi:sugar phosphate isomerase/epimerase